LASASHLTRENIKFNIGIGRRIAPTSADYSIAANLIQTGLSIIIS
jgi:hypothetical protein